MHSSDFSYNVEPAGPRWMVSFCHSPHGSYDRRIDAIRAALWDARRVRRMGHEVIVTVSRPDGVSHLHERVLRPGH